jgi:hypothetical protein
MGHLTAVHDPLRNRLSVLQTRTTHAGFHAGQIRLALTKG